MKRWLLIFVVSLLSLAVSAEEERKIHVFYNGQCDTYLRSNVESITYEFADDEQSEISVMRFYVKIEEEDDEGYKYNKVITRDYALAEVDSVVFSPPHYFAWVTTRSNVHRTYTTSELRGEIGGNWNDWDGVNVGFYISETRSPFTSKDRRTVYAEKSSIPGVFSYTAKNAEGYVGKKYYYYQAWASYHGKFFLVGDMQSFRLDPVIMWTDTYARLEKEDDGHYYKAYVSADIFGDTKEILAEMSNRRAEVGFCYGPEQLPTLDKGNKLEPGWINEVGDLNCVIPHLEPGNKIWVRPYTIIADTIYYGLDFSILTDPWIQVTTLAATDVTATTANVAFTVEALYQEGQLSNGVAGIQFSTTPDLDQLGDETYFDYYNWTPSDNQNYTRQLTKLIPNTTYYYRGYVNVGGKRYLGEIKSFTTKNLEIKTYEVTDITSSSAYITGALLDKDAIVEGNYFGFYYNTTGEPNPNNAKYVYGIFASNSNGTFWWNPDDLEPETRYYVRSFVTYDGKVYLGNIVSFKTEKEEDEGFYGELGLFELKGHVKSCIWTNLWGTNTRTFSQNGFWLTANGWNLSSVYPDGIKRDNAGRIIQGRYDEGGVESWTIDKKGRKITWTDVLWDGGETHTYYYNENDLVYLETVEYLGMDEEWNDNYSVTYSNWVLDSHGNWISRKADNSVHGTSTETREITYY